MNKNDKNGITIDDDEFQAILAKHFPSLAKKTKHGLRRTKSKKHLQSFSTDSLKLVWKPVATYAQVLSSKPSDMAQVFKWLVATVKNELYQLRSTKTCKPARL